MQKKIISGLILIMLIFAVVTSCFIFLIAQNYYEKGVESKLIMTSDIIINNERLENKNDFEAVAKKYAKITSLRVTIIDQNGQVLGESSNDASNMESHLNRPEIIKALDYGQGFVKRYSSTTKELYKYYAKKVIINDKVYILRLAVPINELDKIRGNLITYILMGTLLIFLLAGAIGIKITNKYINPIFELTKISKKISQGDFETELKIKAKNEIGELAQAFSNMQSKLKVLITELENKNIEMDSILNSMLGGLIALDNHNKIILINNTAKKMLNLSENIAVGDSVRKAIKNKEISDLIGQYSVSSFNLPNQSFEAIIDEKILKVYFSPIQRSKLFNKNDIRELGTLIILEDITNIKKLETIRSEFVSNVTHELRTPLVSIKGFTETLKNGAIDEKEVANKFLDIIEIETERLSALIEDILELSEIETIKKDYEIIECDIIEVLNEVLDIVSPFAKKKNVNIIKKINENINTVAINKNRLKQMLINLVDNAIKYNKENGTVEILIENQGQNAVFTISDSGIGINKENIPRLFERFYRVDKGRSRSLGGTGLGLSIVKHIVNLYGGTISVESAFGKGTKFVITLPL